MHFLHEGNWLRHEGCTCRETTCCLWHCKDCASSQKQLDFLDSVWLYAISHFSGAKGFGRAETYNREINCEGPEANSPNEADQVIEERQYDCLHTSSIIIH